MIGPVFDKNHGQAAFANVRRRSRFTMQNRMCSLRGFRRRCGAACENTRQRNLFTTHYRLCFIVTMQDRLCFLVTMQGRLCFLVAKQDARLIHRASSERLV